MAEEQLRITVRLRDFATRSLNRLGGAISRMRRTIISAKSALVALGAAFSVKQLVEYTGRVQGVESAFKSLTSSVGEDYTRVLAALRQGTKGTISDFKLMQNANQALQLGVAQSADDFRELAELSRRLGAAVGRDATDAFQDLVTGIGRGSKLILDNLGIIVDGTVTLEKVLAAARVRVNALGEDTLTLGAAFAQFKTQLANIGTEILKALGPGLTDSFESLARFIRESKPVILNFLADAIEGFKILKDAIADAVGPISNFLLARLRLRVKEVKSELSGILGNLGQGFGEFSGSFENRIARARVGATPEQIREIERARAALDDAQASYNAFLNLVTASSGSPVSGALDKAIASLRSAAREAQSSQEIVNDEFVGPPQALRWFQAVSNAVGGAGGAFQDFGRTAEGAFLQASAGAANLIAKVREAKEAQDELRVSTADAGDGVRAAFELMAKEGRQFGRIAFNAVIDVANALSNNLTNAIVGVIDGTKSAKEAFRDFARAVLSDIARIIVQLLVMQAISRASGGLLSVNIGSGSRHSGGFIPRTGLYQLQRGERVVSPGRPVASGSGRGSVAALSGSGRGGGVTVVQEMTFNVPPNSQIEQAEFIKEKVAEAFNTQVEFRDAMTSENR